MDELTRARMELGIVLGLMQELNDHLVTLASLLNRANQREQDQ